MVEAAILYISLPFLYPRSDLLKHSQLHPGAVNDNCAPILNVKMGKIVNLTIPHEKGQRTVILRISQLQAIQYRMRDASDLTG